MDNRKEYAVRLKHEGRNCAQAVLAACADVLLVPVETLDKIGACFGVGMGCMEATCGALCAAEVVQGLKSFEGRPLLRDAASVCKTFEQRCGGTICKVLKGVGTGTVLCECDDCVRHAIETLEEKGIV